MTGTVFPPPAVSQDERGKLPEHRAEESRFARRPGPNADPLTRRDEALAFDAVGDGAWDRPAWLDRVVVVLVEPISSVNVGGVVRAMANTAFTRLRLVRPRLFDPWDVVGVAHYTQHIVEAASIHDHLADALADCTLVIGVTGKHHRHPRNATPLADVLNRVEAEALSGGLVALVFGREDHGLPNSALDRCHLVTSIPTNPAYPSLNLAQAALLVLYGLFGRAGGSQQVLRPPRRRPTGPASAALLDDLFVDLERALDAVEFFKTRSRLSIMRSLRAALFRARLDRREAALLRAMAIEVRRFLTRQGVVPAIGPIGALRSPQTAVPGAPDPADGAISEPAEFDTAGRQVF